VSPTGRGPEIHSRPIADPGGNEFCLLKARLDPL